MNKQREELAETQAEAEVDGKADGDSADSLICAYEFRMRMGERDSAIDAESCLKIEGDVRNRIPISDDDSVDSTKRREYIN